MATHPIVDYERVTETYKVAEPVHPDDTIIKRRHQYRYRTFTATENFAVETRGSDYMMVARSIKDSGAVILRGGAFKTENFSLRFPRTRLAIDFWRVPRPQSIFRLSLRL